MASTNLAVITARGGSKRIPKKNIRDFCGKPIIAYPIESAFESRLFDEVMVSTDSEEIASVAKRYGASVPFMRSPKNSDDFSTTKDVLIEIIDCYKMMGLSFDIVCCIYPTAPFVTAEKLAAAYGLCAKEIDTVLAMTRFSFPPQRGLVECAEGVTFWQPENANTRSQDLPPIFHDAGQFYYCKPEVLRRADTLLGNATRGYEVSELEVQDIDNLVDWELAELKYERMARSGRK